MQLAADSLRRTAELCESPRCQAGPSHVGGAELFAHAAHPRPGLATT